MTPSSSLSAVKGAATGFVTLFVLSLSFGSFNLANHQAAHAASQSEGENYRLQLIRYQGQQQSDMAPHRGSGRYALDQA